VAATIGGTFTGGEVSPEACAFVFFDLAMGLFPKGTTQRQLSAK
jgi:hypothetical protein